MPDRHAGNKENPREASAADVLGRVLPGASASEQHPFSGGLRACRSCGGTELTTILSLGETPLANSLLTAGQLSDPEPRYPLKLAFCSHCTLVQITETVPRDKLFREYFYLSSFSDTMLAHARDLAHRLIADRKLGSQSRVIEIASNDGYLLQVYKEAGIPVCGIEPAVNVAQVAIDHGIPTVCDFFDASLAQKLKAARETADVIHAHNVLAHVSDLNGMVRGLWLLLKDDGIAVIEVPYVKDMIDRCEFDTIYHEHLCYFSLFALDQLFSRHNLQIVEVERIPIHGGSLCVYVKRQECSPDGNGPSPPPARSSSIIKLLEEETAAGLHQLRSYLGFGARVEQLRDQLVALLRKLKSEGHRIAVYGASAKSSTLLNYFGIGRETLDFVADRSTVKQGHYTPGTHLPIYPPEKLLEAMPHYVLLLTWNFEAEILEQQAEYRRRGGRFIVPIPEVRVV